MEVPFERPERHAYAYFNVCEHRSVSIISQSFDFVIALMTEYSAFNFLFICLVSVSGLFTQPSLGTTFVERTNISISTNAPNCGRLGYQPLYNVSCVPSEKIALEDSPLKRHEKSASGLMSSSSLIKRALLSPRITDNNMDSFVDLVWHRITDHLPSIQPHDGTTTALARQFTNRSDIILGVDKLYGCTVLVVASRRGVYLAHYFDNPGFGSQKPLRQREQDRQFDTIVLGSLDWSVNGVQDPPLAPLVSRQPNQIEEILFGPEDHVKALVVSGRIAGSSSFFFARYVNKLVAKLRQMLPEDALFGTADYELQSFCPMDDPEGLRCLLQHLKRTAVGKLLVQYSPGHGYEVFVGRDPTPKMSDYWRAD